MPRVADLVSRIQRYGHLPANNWKITFGKVSPGEAAAGMYTIGEIPVESTDAGSRPMMGPPAPRDLAPEPTQPRTMQTYYNRMSLSCDSINVPGRSIASIVDGAIGVGAEQPYARMYEGDLTVVMIIGKEAWERKIFEEWMDEIAHPKSGKISYYKDYVCDAHLTLFDRQDKPKYKIIFEELYPKMVSPIQLSNETPDLIRQQIDFAYRLYRPVNLGANGTLDESSTELTGLHSSHPVSIAINNIRDGIGNSITQAVNGGLLDLTESFRGIYPW